MRTQESNQDLHWELDWGHIQAIIEGPARPIAWSSSNPILYAHPHLPQVQGKLFHGNPALSPTPFDIPNPSQLQLTPLFYAPPTIISLSPDDGYLFAYFPPSRISATDGLACIWQSRGALCSWEVKEVWPAKKGHGIVACRWLNEQRQWVNLKAKQQRAQRVGPFVPRRAAFFVVTESSQIHLVYRSERYQQQPLFNILRAPLLVSWASHSNSPSLPDALPQDLGGSKICTRAEIGFLDDDETVLVAFKTRLLAPIPNMANPNALVDDTSADTFLPMSQHNTDWEAWTEANDFDLCEVRVDFSPELISIETFPSSTIPSPQALPFLQNDPLTPLDEAADGTEKFVHFAFINSPYLINKSGLGSIAGDGHPGLSLLSNGGQVRDANLTAEHTDIPSHLYLICGTLSPPTGSTSPKSYLCVYRFNKGRDTLGFSLPIEGNHLLSNSSNASVNWVGSLVRREKLNDQAIVFMKKCRIGADEDILVGVVDLHGAISTESVRAVIGEVHSSLRMFSSAKKAQSLGTLTCHRDLAGRYVPNSIAISPNGSYAVAINGEPSSHALSVIKLNLAEVVLDQPTLAASISSVHPVTQSYNPSLHGNSQDLVASSIASAMKNKADISDNIRYILTSDGRKEPGFYTRFVKAVYAARHPDAASQVAGLTTSVADSVATKPPEVDFEVASFALAFFKSPTNAVRDYRWRTALWILQLRGIYLAFDEISSYSSGMIAKRRYESPSMERLVGYASATSEFCENLVKEALVWDAWGLHSFEDNVQARFAAGSLLILIHPHLNPLLLRILDGLFQLQTWMEQNQETQLKALNNIFANAKIDIKAFASVLLEVQEATRLAISESPDLLVHFTESSVTLTLHPALAPLTQNLLRLLDTRPTHAQRMALLVPSLDVLDSDNAIASIPMAQPRDIITKLPLPDSQENGSEGGPLQRTCFLCGERSRISEKGYSTWAAYERHWQNYCVCGGRWILHPNNTASRSV